MGTPGGNDVWVLPHITLPDEQKQKDADSLFAAHFWAVNQVKGSDGPNMEISWEDYKVHG